jgi:ABC-type Na+ transport system ATPase subunit NatA
MIADLREIPQEEQTLCLSETIYATGLADHLTRPFSQLSKGFQQRVGLAQAACPGRIHHRNNFINKTLSDFLEESSTPEVEEINPGPSR